MAELSLSILDRDGLVFTGNVAAVSAVNAKGKFDILPMHSNFISLMGGTLILILPDSTKKEIPVDNGIVKVRENKVEIYLGIKK